MDEIPTMLTAGQAAKILGVSRSEIYRLAQDSVIGRKWGGIWVFTPGELEKRKSTNPGRGQPRKKS